MTWDKQTIPTSPALPPALFSPRLWLEKLLFMHSSCRKMVQLRTRAHTCCHLTHVGILTRSPQWTFRPCQVVSVSSDRPRSDKWVCRTGYTAQQLPSKCKGRSIPIPVCGISRPVSTPYSQGTDRSSRLLNKHQHHLTWLRGQFSFMFHTHYSCIHFIHTKGKQVYI